MQYKEFQNVKISGIACAVPNNYVLTETFKQYYGDKKVERFIEGTGIKGRYISNGNQTAQDLSFVAAKAIMEKKGLTGSDIDAVVLVTQTPDYKIPASAFVLHKRLGIKKDCLVFDVNLGCSGYVNGIYIIAGLIESGVINKALLLVGDSDTNREISDNTSFTMMFGDASSATVIERGEGKIQGMIRADGEGFNAIINPIPGARFPYNSLENDTEIQCKMNGDDIFLFTITKVPKLFKEFYECFNCNADSFDYFVLHQANKMIINQISKKLKISSEKVPVSIEKYGNTDGASIPVSIVDLCEKLEDNKNLKLITSGFGIGLSWGIVSFEINSEDVLPMIITSDYFEEGKNV